MAALAALTTAWRRSYDDNGGAVLVAGGSLALANCAVSDSTCSRLAGGGIYAADGSRVSIADSEIAGNHGI